MVIGTYRVNGNGKLEDLTHPVEFDGELLAYLDRHTETGAVGERLYRTAAGRLIVWARVSTEEPQRSAYSLHEITKADLLPGGRFAELGAKADLGNEALSLNEALNLSKSTEGTMTKELTVTSGDGLVLSNLGLSIADTEAALRRPLAEVVEAALNATSKSKHTRRAYETAIAMFLDYLDGERGDLLPETVSHWRPFVQKRVNGDLVAVTVDTGRAGAVYVYGEAAAAVLRLVDAGLLDGYAAYRAATGDKANTVVSRLAAVRAFLSVALRDNILTQEQAVNMGLSPYKAKQSRDTQIVGRRLAKPEVRALLDTVDTETTKGKRDLAMLSCMLYAGLRAEETASLRLNNLKLDKGRWWLVLKGKGKKQRRVKMHDALFEALSGWTAAAGLDDWGQDRRPLFYAMTRGDNVKASQVTPTDISRLVAAASAAAGLSPPSGPGRLGAHDLRRSCARNAYDNGATLLQVQKLLGHSDPKTTAAYIGLGEEETETAADFIHY